MMSTNRLSLYQKIINSFSHRIKKLPISSFFPSFSVHCHPQLKRFDMHLAICLDVFTEWLYLKLSALMLLMAACSNRQLITCQTMAAHCGWRLLFQRLDIKCGSIVSSQKITELAVTKCLFYNCYLKVSLNIVVKELKGYSASITSPSGIEEPCFIRKIDEQHIGHFFEFFKSLKNCFLKDK